MSEVALLLQEDDIELMEAATILHYVGMFINHKAYHRHSHYLIKVLFSFLDLFQVLSQPTMSTHDILLTHPFFLCQLWCLLFLDAGGHAKIS